MSDRFQKQDYLKDDQYKNADKLAARIRLHVDYSTNDQDIFRWLWDVALPHLPATGDMLEVGCGRGDMWQQNAERIPEGWSLTFTDLSDGMLDDHRAFVGDAVSDAIYRQCDVQDLPFADDSFDIAFANMMLYHVPDLDAALAELRRVLKPQGVLVAMTNGDDHMRDIYHLAKLADPHVDAPNIYHDSFSLQNGGAALNAHFAQVERHDYDCDLVVDDPQPIIDYIASMVTVPGDELVREHGGVLREKLNARLAANDGEIRIEKQTGTFIARSAE